ncbi:HD-GYP domain-containing protein [Aliiglaciecola sp. CAU 1673]|uniref:HD-GYP domain-containing protein n=1 Tax=Aliiglaciecola sp. CAU 1673 TaxID=3032595 RepID=UPI0023DC2401|nr:HD-GYP domain-containing protein [Aliiglaciecola sp. CAU 1673]MDF2178340.1 HD-GYP domain-containing protein [Aliiglaciecola sp. CAU 1673]
MAKLKIHPDQLLVGMYVRLPSGWMKHPFLFNSFKLSTDEQIRVIRSLKLPFVVIDQDKSDVAVPPMPKKPVVVEAEDPEVLKLKEQMEREKRERIERLKDFRRSLQRTEKAFQRSMIQVRNLMGKLGSRPLEAIEDAQQMIGDMADMIMDEGSVVLHLMNPDKQGEDLYFHSLNVSVLAMMMAKQCKLSKQDAKDLGLAALFHDVGKLKIPTSVLRKPGALTKPEENLLKMHCQYGVELLSLSDNFPKSLLPLVLQHHEFEDGSGYPRGLKGTDMHPLAKILVLVNQYDNLCHPNRGEPGKIPYAALSHLFKQMKGKLADRETKVLVTLLGVYPPGSLVQLTDKRVGMVMSVNTADLLNPSVLLYDGSVPSTEAPMIDLKDSDVKIDRVLKPAQLPQPVFEYLNPRARISYFVDKG